VWFKGVFHATTASCHRDGYLVQVCCQSRYEWQREHFQPQGAG
jgi:hypothetical protein